MSSPGRIENLGANWQRWLSLAGIAAATACLAACEPSDGSVGISSGQDPDPVALDFPIAYTKGPLFDEDGELGVLSDIRVVERFNVGTDLFLLDRASPTATERNITLPITLGQGDVQGVEISADGRKVLFAMRGPFDPDLNDEDQPSWNIWEYDIPSAALRRIIPDDLTAEEGNDIDPHYLADGRIIFSSTRQSQSKAILVDEGKQQFVAIDERFRDFTYVLHVMDADGNNIRQVSFNQSHDLQPMVRSNGKVAFTRWDNAGNNDAMHLYQMDPDGGEAELLYGARSHATGTDGGTVQFINPREMRDGRIMAIAREFDHPELGGDVVTIDVNNYVENTQPIVTSLGLPGPAQASATGNQVRTDLLPSPGGRFSSAFPLWDGTGRVLISWSICRLVVDPAAAVPVIAPCTAQNLAISTAVPAAPLYGIWIYNPVDRTQLPVVLGREGVLVGEVVAAQPRANPVTIFDAVPGVDAVTAFINENVGVLNIRSVYDLDGVDVAEPDIRTLADPAFATADERPARFVRIIKAVSIPGPDVLDLDGSAFGPNIFLGMREIVGYAPVEPDGSVRVKVPANVALAIDVLDANARSVSGRHLSWLQVMPGQELRCNGCHSPFSDQSHGRSTSFASVWSGATGNGIAFANTNGALSPDFSETMAETRTRLSCRDDNCAALELNLDVMYEDVWTDPVQAGRPIDAPFAYSYQSLAGDLPELPVNFPGCLTDWSALCRSIINYETHIHPLWSVDRGVDTCTSSGCHAPRDALNQLAPPAAQLDLSDGPSPQVAAQFNAYRELLFADDAQEVVNGALQDIVTGIDVDGNPILVTVLPSMSHLGANFSDTFFSRFEAGGSHAGQLSPDELRIISEWLDIGAQYYNNPFDAPGN